MKTMGEKIKLLRAAAGLTQEQLAEIIGVACKTIQRYENDKFKPDVYILARLAAYFDVSADYLLGLIGYQKQRKEETFKIRSDKQRNPLYARYLQCRSNYSIDSESDYYAIFLNEDMTTMSLQTEWVGWANSDMTHEIRQIRPVIPHKYIDLCKTLCESIMVINCKEDVDAFLVFGGKALVRADICEQHLPNFCEKFVVRRGEY